MAEKITAEAEYASLAAECAKYRKTGAPRDLMDKKAAAFQKIRAEQRKAAKASRGK